MIGISLGILVIIIFLNLLNAGGNPILIAILSFLGPFLIFCGIASIKSNKLYDLIHDKNFVGKNLKKIEELLGPHSSVNIVGKNKRIYIWDDYLELLCDENNNCIEVLKNIYGDVENKK